MCNPSGGTELDKAVKFRISRSAHFRGWNKYAGTYPAKMSTMVLIFADGAHAGAREFVPRCTFTRRGSNTLLHRPWASCTFQTGNSCTLYFLSGRFLHKIMLDKILWKALQSGRALFLWEDYYIVKSCSKRPGEENK